MNSVQSATEQQEQIGSFKRRLRKRRDDDFGCISTRALGEVAESGGGFGVLFDLVLLQKVYVKQFYFEKRVGSGGQEQKVPGAWLLLLVNASASCG